jgi:hypothetical protein
MMLLSGISNYKTQNLEDKMTDYNAILDSIDAYYDCDCDPKEKKSRQPKSPNIDRLDRSKTRKAELEKTLQDNFRQMRAECRAAIESIQQTVDLDEPTLILLAKHYEDFKELNKLIAEAGRSKYCLTALTQPKASKLTYSKGKK